MKRKGVKLVLAAEEEEEQEFLIWEKEKSLSFPFFQRERVFVPP